MLFKSEKIQRKPTYFLNWHNYETIIIGRNYWKRGPQKLRFQKMSILKVVLLQLTQNITRTLEKNMADQLSVILDTWLIAKEILAAVSIYYEMHTRLRCPCTVQCNFFLSKVILYLKNPLLWQVFMRWKFLWRNWKLWMFFLLLLDSFEFFVLK